MFTRHFCGVNNLKYQTLKESADPSNFRAMLKYADKHVGILVEQIFENRSGNPNIFAL